MDRRFRDDGIHFFGFKKCTGSYKFPFRVPGGMVWGVLINYLRAAMWRPARLEVSSFHFFYVSTRWGWVVSFTFRALYPMQSLVIRWKPDGPETRSGRRDEEKHNSSYQESNLVQALTSCYGHWAPVVVLHPGDVPTRMWFWPILS
jgi:hypothetical protein